MKSKTTKDMKLHMLTIDESSVADRFLHAAIDAWEAIGDGGMGREDAPLVMAAAALTQATVAMCPHPGSLGLKEDPSERELQEWIDKQKAVVIEAAGWRTADERSEALAFIVFLRLMLDGAMAALKEAKKGDRDEAWVAAANAARGGH